MLQTEMAVNSTSQWVNCGHLVLIAAMNAGPCRQYSDLKRACTSSIGVIQRYRKRIADLEDVDVIQTHHRAEVLQCRTRVLDL
ncbi:MAG: ATP-binding protein [Anaerolineae bacterium]|nr:ATP-binding protein [Anaerolineae bacterium]